MRKLVILIIVIVATILASLPLHLQGWTGAYNPWSGLIWCSDHNSCIHEVGHKLDDSAGWVSRKGDFEINVHQFVVTEITNGKPGELAIMLATYPIESNRIEVYADIFLYSDGNEMNMPLEFRQFYDWELAKTLLKKYKTK